MGSMGADLIKEARRRAGLTQRELAERAGTTQSAIARAESGRVDPGFETVRRLMRLSGFNLLVALDPYDDSDLWQARQLLRSTPEERFDYMVRGANTMASMRGIAAEQARRAG